MTRWKKVQGNVIRELNIHLHLLVQDVLTLGLKITDYDTYLTNIFDK